MGFRNKFGVTKIKKTLDINYDADYFEDLKSKKKIYPVLLFTPLMDQNNTDIHYHIQLTRKEAEKLSIWLNEYLKVTKKRSKKTKVKRATKKR
jgi:hypothetical protein